MKENEEKRVNEKDVINYLDECPSDQSSSHNSNKGNKTNDAMNTWLGRKLEGF